MITAEPLALYVRYNGDADMWSRVHDRHELSLMTDQDWRDIDFILQDLTSLKNGLCARDYEADILRRLREISFDSEVEMKLMALA